MYEENEQNLTGSGGAQSGAADGGPQIYSVSQLNEQARRLLERSFAEIWLEGEVSRPTIAASGHAYFTLKDEDAAISCACFRAQLARSRCRPEAGIKVLARGRVSIYPAQGRYQFIVSYMEDAGEGALQRQYEALKKKLAAEGLFATEHKQPLPVLPRRVGLITSETGAVIHDMITTFRKRFPAIALRLYPVSVQGASAVNEIVAALQLAQRRADCDALILARGGGSLEDLMAFNDERVARAVFECRLPIVCGVGHEPDVSIADFVADYRAATPTAAAEALSPDRNDWIAGLQGYQKKLAGMVQDRLQSQAQRVDLTRKRLIHPKTRLRELRRRLSDYSLRLRRELKHDLDQRQRTVTDIYRRLRTSAPDRRLQRDQQQLQRLRDSLMRQTRMRLARQQQHLHATAARLQTVSPLATLERGYAIIEKPESKTTAAQIVRDAKDVKRGELLHARLSDGRLDLIVEDTQIDKKPK